MFNSTRFNLALLSLALLFVSLQLSPQWYSGEVRSIPFSVVSLDVCTDQGSGPVCSMTIEGDDGTRYVWDHLGYPNKGTVFLYCKGRIGEWHCGELSGEFRERSELTAGNRPTAWRALL